MEPLEYFGISFGIFVGEGLRDRFGTLLGSMLYPFLTSFGSSFGVILEVFLLKTWFYFHGSSFFKSFDVFNGFFVVGGHLRNSGCTRMGVQLLRICLRFL